MTNDKSNICQNNNYNNFYAKNTSFTCLNDSLKTLVYIFSYIFEVDQTHTLQNLTYSHR